MPILLVHGKSLRWGVARAPGAEVLAWAAQRVVCDQVAWRRDLLQGLLL